MTTEEKARAYDEALKRAKAILKVADKRQESLDYVSTIFPELKESEDDEKIRNRILLSLEKDLMATKNSGCSTKDLEQCIAWLEKQGDQKTDKYEGYCEGCNNVKGCVTCVDGDQWAHYKEVEQKPAVTDFNAKDWYVSKVDGKIHDMTYNPTDKVEPKFKIGDYIVSDYCMGRVVEITSDAYLLDIGQGIPFSCEDKVHLWTIADANEGNILAGKIDGDNYILIFKTIKDGWIETYGHYYNAVDRFCVPSQLFCISYQGTFTPATKEQRNTLMKAMTDAGYTFDFEKKELKKIEDEIEIPFGAKDSELQEETYYIPKSFHAEIDDDKVVIKKGEKSAEWSEEDDYNLQCMIAKVTSDIQKGNVDRNNELIDWLKSLKDRITWKPSKEQMEALDDALNERGFDYNYLNSLYEQLKKL